MLFSLGASRFQVFAKQSAERHGCRRLGRLDAEGANSTIADALDPNEETEINFVAISI